MSRRESARVLIVGVGGLGCPAALALARGGVGTLALCDDDVVDASNLHRQILFDESAIGKPKLGLAAEGLRARFPAVRIEAMAARFLPENALALLRDVDVVVEGSDNFPTKFLVADACALAGVPVVHGAAVRWHGTALAVGPKGRPCYRCLFEDIPHEHVANCAEAGVLGPIVGVVGALQADLALRVLDGGEPFGTLSTYDGLSDRLRTHAVSARTSCELCGTRQVRGIERSRYAASDPCAL